MEQIKKSKQLNEGGIIYNPFKNEYYEITNICFKPDFKENLVFVRPTEEIPESNGFSFRLSHFERFGYIVIT